MIKENQPRSEHQSRPNKFTENNRDPLWLTVIYTIFTYLLLSYVLPKYLGTESAAGITLIKLFAENALYVSSLWLLPEAAALIKFSKLKREL